MKIIGSLIPKIETKFNPNLLSMSIFNWVNPNRLLEYLKESKNNGIASKKFYKNLQIYKDIYVWHQAEKAYQISSKKEKKPELPISAIHNAKGQLGKILRGAFFLQKSHFIKYYKSNQCNDASDADGNSQSQQQPTTKE